MTASQIIALAIFVAVIAVIVSEKLHRAACALIGAVLLILIGILEPHEALGFIDFNTIGVLIGMMMFVDKEDAPKVIFADAVIGSKTNILVRDMAKLLQQNGYDIGEKRLYCWLRDNKYLTLSNMPMQRYSEMGLFFVDEGVHSENGEMASHFTTKVTPKGQQYFINKFIRS